MATTHLKPCPFCKGKRVTLDDVGSGFAVNCQRARCRVMGPLVLYGSIANRDANREKLEADAARRWNTRSIASAEATIREANGEATP